MMLTTEEVKKTCRMLWPWEKQLQGDLFPVVNNIGEVFWWPYSVSLGRVGLISFGEVYRPCNLEIEMVEREKRQKIAFRIIKKTMLVQEVLGVTEASVDIDPDLVLNTWVEERMNAMGYTLAREMRKPTPARSIPTARGVFYFPGGLTVPTGRLLVTKGYTKPTEPQLPDIGTNITPASFPYYVNTVVPLALFTAIALATVACLILFSLWTSR